MNQSELNVLIIEDNLGDARLIQEFLREAASSGVFFQEIQWYQADLLSGALKIVADNSIDIILLDLSLPDSHGIDTFLTLQKVVPTVPIVILSGMNDEKLALRALKQGAQEYLVKGFIDARILGRAIRYAVERQQLLLDLKQKNRALIASEARRRNVIENSTDGIVVFDESHIIRYANPAATKMLAAPYHKLFGQQFDTAVTTPQNGELTIKRSERTIIVEMRVVPSEWRGEPASFAYLRDITQQKMDKVVIREQDEKLRSIISSMDDLVFVMDEDGRFLSYAHPTEKSGIREVPSFILGQSFAEILPVHVVPMLRNAIDAVKQVGWVQQIEYPLFNQEKVYWFSAKISARKDRQGEITGLTMVVRDITEIKEATEALRLKNSQLEILREIALELSANLDLSALLDAIALGALRLVNGTSCWLYLFDESVNQLRSVVHRHALHATVSEAASELSDALSSQVWDSRQPVLIEPEKADEPEEAVDEPMVGVPIRWHDELLGVLVVASSPNLIYSPADSRLLSLYAMQTAVAVQNAYLHAQAQQHNSELEEKVLERTHELIQANQRLELMDKLKTKFIHDISHELRTPTANIDLYISLLKRGQPNKFNQYVKVLDKESKRLTQLIESILNYSSLILNKDNLKHQLVDMNHIVEQIVSGYRPHADSLGLSLCMNITRESLMVLGAAPLLQQVVSNLVTNAIVYSTTGKITVTLDLEAAPYQACFQVQDMGRGILPEDLPHLFKRFYRGTDVGQSNIPGVGLGLAIVKEVVDMHNGRIDVQSTPEKGSTFTIWLPLAQQPEQKTDVEQCPRVTD